jgi:DNA/RNA-binding domain of Phe-tRNA-synthetase-like protein
VEKSSVPVRLATFTLDGVTAVGREPRLDEPLRRAAAAMRTATESADVVAAVRTMYKRVGLDPTKTRPSSEALLRRVRRGDELPRINSLVDVVNWCSLESQLPFGLYDADGFTAASSCGSAARARSTPASEKTPSTWQDA